MNEVKARDREYIAGTYGRFDLEIVRGRGSLCYDENGREYIDMGSGIGVNVFGYSDPEWTAAVSEQLTKLQHTSNLYYTAPDSELAEKICLRTGMKKVFFCNSGAEANECAIKAARKYSAEKHGTTRCTILTLCSSFHGRTLTTLAATGQEKFHKLYAPLTPGFVSSSEIGEIERLAKIGALAGIMIECVQGEGGVNKLEPEFVSRLAAVCGSEDIPLIIDEVQTGNGRTGELYSYMHYGIKPDIFTTAKGLGGGLPIGACVLGDKVKDVFAPGDNGSTFGGNPAVCAGAVNILDRLTPEFIADVARKGEYLAEEFRSCPGVKSVSGLGLMIGVEPFGSAPDIVKKCLADGVLCLTAAGNKIRLLPPLNIPDDLLEKAAAVIKKNCEEAAV